MATTSTHRIGVFGGTFNPVHWGHLILAEQCREQAHLHQVWFVPAARPPHKQEQPITPFAQRVEMLQLAVAGHPVFQVKELEKDRPGPSFTADTLEELHRGNPSAELFLIIGSDCLPDLTNWRDPTRLGTHLTALLVAPRPGHPLATGPLPIAENASIGHQPIDSPLIDISSRDIRGRVASGRTIRYLLPRAVECYIEAHGLYKQGPAIH